MPIYGPDSELARMRDEFQANIAAGKQAELRKAVEQEPDRFVSPEQFAEMAARMEDGE